MEEEYSLDELKQMRSTTKGSITRIKTYVETNGKTLSSTELECRLGILESYFKQVLAYQTKIERLVPQDTGRAELEDQFISLKSRILALLGTYRRSSVVDTTMSVPHSANHLPKQRLPKFSGRYSEYKGFIDAFTNLVDSEPSLSKIEKFRYLLQCLDSQALDTVKAFQLTEENYPKALAKLKERYDNDCLIFMEYIAELSDLPKVPKASAVQLRSLVDNISALFSSLLSIGSHENICNAIIISIALSKVDPETQSKYDEQLDYSKLPTWDECAKVLGKRCQYLEARDSKQLRSDVSQKGLHKHQKSTPSSSSNQRPQSSFTVTQKLCGFCQDPNHSISNCLGFSGLSVADRFLKVKKLGLCLNCLRKGHGVSQCPSTYRCKSCKKPHHSLLHRTQPKDDETNTGPATSASTNSALERENKSRAQVILATAVILVKDSTGSFQMGRALLDSGSQVNFINEKFAKSLHLHKQRKNVDILGIGVSETKIHFLTQTTIRSRYTSFEVSLEFLVAPAITGYQPESSLNVSNWNIPSHLDLADESFNQRSRIDLLLGAEAFFDILKDGQVQLAHNLPSLRNTELGWIVSGSYKTQTHSTSKSCFATFKDNSLEEYVEKFWEIEEVQDSNLNWTEEQKQCEEHFTKNIEVLGSGRLMVQLPMKKCPSSLGSSYDIAFRRFLSLERRLANNKSLKTQYVSFLEEYETLGHMSLVKNPDLSEPHYYLPHQCVLRPNSASTKLRVVFDASCCTSSQISLNGILMVGPKTQDDLFIILLRFRLYQYALTADIVKMYRQVLVHPCHRRFQYILWRESENTPVQTYQLNTVTYGTSSAPFLAIRCLKFLAEQNQQYELGASTLQSDFYVDDMLTGADELSTLLQKKNEVVDILKSAGFELSKWNSNHSDFVQQPENREIKLTESSLSSTLGIAWNSQSDEFIFSYKPSRSYSTYTKKVILSISSSLFDPMGLLSPIIITAKIILQKLWIEKVGWNSPIPQTIDTEWRQFMVEMNLLQNIAIPRFALIANKESYQIHGFADASMQAYGCCIYLRSKNEYGIIDTKLLVAKSRVAPSKRKQLPRLELCAAHLLAKLWRKIQPIFKNNHAEIYFWTDAAIVLHWINTHPSKLNTFVGNRVSETQELTKTIRWRHVPTLHNPADIVSRGCKVEELKTSIWFKGPAFLQQSEEKWPSLAGLQLPYDESALEMKKTSLVCQNVEPQSFMQKVIDRYSSYTQILRSVAYFQRFIKWIISRAKKEKFNDYQDLSAVDLEKSLFSIVAFIQKSSFSEEIRAIQAKTIIKGTMKWLNPFIQDLEGISLLRVGGRLKHADIPEESKHPLILPKDSNFTKALVRHLHISNYHAGPKSLTALVRQQFWIVNVRDLARQIVRQCPSCVRYRPKLLQQIMGDLPSSRLTPARPFQSCGVDFCGPINTYLKIRGKVPYKSYVAVFVCFSSKAVHLEAVSDLSADAFIASLKRMIGRRGLPRDIHCDNATNFVGAQSKLLELRNMLFKKSNRETITKFCTNAFINFHFIPPRAPHFGGIWEAAVKVAKGHLYRSLAGAKLTFEELSTALVEIEAVMNSRPITSMSSDPNDVEALTPAHLLIGSSLKAIPEPAVEVADISYIERWRRINAVKTHFWTRWSKEYIHELQGRSKWASTSQNLTIGTLVIIHEDNIPPQRWMLGRVTNVIQGADGKVRVADVKTTRGVFRRPIRKLAAIPS